MPDTLYFHHSTTDDLAFFWDAEAAPYPAAKYYQDPDLLDDAGLDPGIRGLVRKLNQAGWAKTVMSCEGHPERDNAYAAHVEIWLRVPDASGLGPLFDWLQRAVGRRQEISTVFKDDRLINVKFIGQTRWGYYFIVFGRFVSTVENHRVIRALEETL